MVIYHTSDLSILDDIRKMCKTREEYNFLLSDIKKLFIRDFFALQRDRTGNNFLFKETENGIRLAPLYDYEWAFESINPSIYKNQMGTLNINNPYTEMLLREDDEFRNLLNLLINIDMYKLISEVEHNHEISISMDYKRHCFEQTEEVKKLVIHKLM